MSVCSDSSSTKKGQREFLTHLLFHLHVFGPQFGDHRTSIYDLRMNCIHTKKNQKIQQQRTTGVPDPVGGVMRLRRSLMMSTQRMALLDTTTTRGRPFLCFLGTASSSSARERKKQSDKERARHLRGGGNRETPKGASGKEQAEEQELPNQQDNLTAPTA